MIGILPVPIITPALSGGIVVPDFKHFYRMGQGGGAYTFDSGPSPSNLVNGDTTQYDDPVQGKVCTMDASPINQGFTNVGKPTVLDGPFTYSFIFSSDSFGNVILCRISGGDCYVQILNSTTINIDPLAGTIKSYTVPEMIVDKYYHCLISADEDFNTKLYLNGTISSSGAQAMLGTLNFDAIGNYSSGTTFDWLGGFGNFRIYDRQVTDPEAVLISDQDLKEAA